MNPLYAQCLDLLKQLENIITQIREEDFIRPSQTLSGSSIGQHVRHTIEFFLCLESGLECGIINYDKRRHDKVLATNPSLALAALLRIRYFITSQKDNLTLKFETSCATESHYVLLDTNYLRELAYNIEHTVHHMAILKIGLREIAPYITLAENFGVAASTVRCQAKEQFVIQSEA